MAIDTTSPRTRRAILLGALGAAAASAMSVVGRASPVRATDGETVKVGHTYTATTVTEISATGTDALTGSSDTQTGLTGGSGTGTGVYGHSAGIGVFGLSGSGDAVYGESSGQYAVHGVLTRPSGFAAAVIGEITNPDGVAGLGNNYATSGNAQGVQGTSDSPKGLATTGWARHGGAGVIGVSGAAFPSVPAKTGVYGNAAAGRGVVASGGKAQLRLIPSTATTHPHSGALGDLFLDKSGRLWFCKGGTTWKQLV